MAAFCNFKIPMTVNGKSWDRECGACDDCRNGKIQSLVGRCVLEAEMAAQTAFVTFTYADHGRAGAKRVIDDEARSYADVQKLFKRMRKAGMVFRYVVACEYGEKNGRFHHHAILYFRDPVKLPEHGKRVNWPFWPHGFTQFKEFGEGTAGFAYVCKYLVKTVGDEHKGTVKRNGRGRWEGDVAERVRWSRVPVFGMGPRDWPEDQRALVRRARALVESGLPFTRYYTAKEGFYYAGTQKKPVRYFVDSPSLQRAYYAAYCREYFRKHGLGDPPIVWREVVESEAGPMIEKKAVLRAAYGDMVRTMPAQHDELLGEVDRRWHWPLPYAKDRTVAQLDAFVKREKVVSARRRVFVLRDGRILAQQWRRVTPEVSTSQYTHWRNRKDGQMTEAYGWQAATWPVRSRRDLLAFVRQREGRPSTEVRAAGTRQGRTTWRSRVGGRGAAAMQAKRAGEAEAASRRRAGEASPG